jgi:hypothetical protein
MTCLLEAESSLFLSSRLRPKHLLKSGPNEPYPDQVFAGSAGGSYVHYLAARCKVCVSPAPRLMRSRNSYIQISANRHFKARYKRRATPAQIFAGSFFGEYHATRIPPGYLHRQAHGNSAFSPLSRDLRARWHRRTAPRFAKPLPAHDLQTPGAQKNLLPHRALRRESALREPFA